jgi:two-component system CheB/CheR fusion protein
VVVLSPGLEVEVWSDKAQDLWGLRNDEVAGQPFLELDIGLPVARLDEPIRQCLDGGDGDGVQTVLDGVNRRGRPIRCKVTCTRLMDGPGVAGVILLMEEQAGAAAARPS